MISLDTLTFLNYGAPPSPSLLTFCMEAPAEVHEFVLDIGGERRRIELTCPPEIAKCSIVGPVRPGQEAAEAVASYLVRVTRAGVVTIDFGKQRVYQGPPDSALAALYDHPWFLTHRARRQ